jgi:hypothetical protein
VTLLKGVANYTRFGYFLYSFGIGEGVMACVAILVTAAAVYSSA